MGYININTCDVSSCTHENFVIDSNALLHSFYPNSAPSYAASYSNFVSNLITEGKTIYIPIFVLIESINVIEKIELEIYNRTNNTSYKIKSFRDIPLERQKVKNNIDLFLAQIKSISQIKILPQTLNEVTINAFADKFELHKLDLFDFYLEELCNNNSYPIITNDADFTKGIHSIDVYTSNPRILTT